MTPAELHTILERYFTESERLSVESGRPLILTTWCVTAMLVDPTTGESMICAAPYGDQAGIMGLLMMVLDRERDRARGARFE